MNLAERAPITRFGGKVSFFSFGAMSMIDGRAYRLKYELEKFSSVTEELRKNWQEEMKSLPQFPTMNMAVLALALVILQNLENEGKGEGGFELADIRNQLDLYIDTEFPPDDKEYFITGLKKKEDTFRYIRLIIDYRATR
ncbi:Hypothetical protein BQ3484_468 [Cedratvirus A11]|uniref:Uncharacterized protein n=1 Tax=Cedratvirus A11 TaxID=1903266 RepID=A0A1M7XV27_9VIRU|nr:Hypothetical protein BQ3484_468 [Cedratvirus A11]SHO33536.1 Hypothetical protein BQ3484_468 [Cedratvirus A11]